ncbi:DUF6455 family protein [Roseicella aquatilis]|uniref:DUF6455 family protein n=1 Tax=Roseicella aquatilis TaxID=2527868 RepID=UPI00197FDD7C|nr:DUF6455 family protein [Roseicella aquatilis]
MLTYNDCLGLSGLTPEQVAALAHHEHLPEIVALEMGWSLCGTPEGQQRIRRMILDEVAAVCRQGDPRAGARLGLALHRFLEAHGTPKTFREAWEEVPTALGLGPAEAARLRERLATCFAPMLERVGLDEAAQARRPDQMRAAALCCAACTEAGRCRRFLAGQDAAGPPVAFCPNAGLFAALQDSAGGREGPDR